MYVCILYVWMIYVCVSAGMSEWVCENNFRSQFSPCLWALGTKLSSQVCMARTFSCRAILWSLGIYIFLKLFLDWSYHLPWLMSSHLYFFLSCLNFLLLKCSNHVLFYLIITMCLNSSAVFISRRTNISYCLMANSSHTCTNSFTAQVSPFIQLLQVPCFEISWPIRAFQPIPFLVGKVITAGIGTNRRLLTMAS